MVSRVWTDAARRKRLHSTPEKDQRKPFEVDRDRIQYSSALHRLAGVTQIVRVGEADVFHTRQQHTYKVAQVGRRLAQNCIDADPKLAKKLGVEVEVVEAACLAHDLGHPPFGHAGEAKLDELVEERGDPDGFEGNAQTFRILTKLGVRYPDCLGLDLTRATLSACLKYPWTRDPTKPERSSKWGAYKVDQTDFDFARKYQDHAFQTTEAALMDWADDIAYSVHDLEDFHRVGAIPWNHILNEGSQDIIHKTHEVWFGAPGEALAQLNEGFDRLALVLNTTFSVLLNTSYEGSREQRVALRSLTSFLIGRFLTAAKLTEEGNGLHIPLDTLVEVKLLKQIAKQYIISNPSLIAQQLGQKKVIEELFNILWENSEKGCPKFLPVRLRHIWEICEGQRARFAADCIASLTEHEVMALHGRLCGLSGGSVLDPIVR